ncbi:hypothetical protein RGQ29_015631 [Quercus rubra]|uniref:Uncharacterized protein n=1 Tax=Quercus rubra TaxID=3512 RepID=A0AAN7FQJ7_QUERU|nr:hypothetical protein RGQ29_015631 [Quercus rubra]
MASNGVVENTGAGLIVSFGDMLIDFVTTVSGVSLAEAPGFLKVPGGDPLLEDRREIGVRRETWRRRV